MNKHLIIFILLLVIVIGNCNAGPLNWIFTRRIFSNPNRNKNSKKTNSSNTNVPKNSINSKKPNFLESNK